MRRLKFLYADVFLMQFGNSVGATGLALTAKISFAAPVWGLAAIGMTGPIVYTALCLVLGRAKGRVKAEALTVWGAAVMAATFALAVWATRTWHLAVASACSGAGAAFYWPMIEALIMKGTSGRGVLRRTGAFNISWSLGEALGTAATGFLFALRPSLPYALTVLTMPAVIALVASSRRLSEIAEALDGADESDGPAPAAVNAGFRKAAWVGNFAGAGVSNVLRSVFAAPARDAFRMSAPAIGLAIGTFSALRTVTFVVLGRWHTWRYRGRMFLAVNGLLALGMMGVFAAGFLPAGIDVALVFVSLSAAGVGSGMTYFSSIFYTIDRPELVESTAPIHEAVLGAGGSAAALAAGFTGQMASGALGVFVMCAAVVAAGIAISANCIRGAGQNAPAGTPSSAGAQRSPNQGAA